MISLELKPLTVDLLPPALELDRCCFGGLWTEEGYRRELDSPNSDLLVLETVSDVARPCRSLDTPFVKASQTTGKEEGKEILKDDAATRSRDHTQFSPTDRPHQSPSLVGLGCLWAILEEAHITILAVHPAIQRRGLGQLLLYALLVKAQRRGLEWATLEVRESNQVARSLYQKFGFQTVGTRRRYYPDTGEDAVILWRPGLQQPDFDQMLQAWRNQVGDRLHQAGYKLSVQDECLQQFGFPLDGNPHSS